MKKFLEAGFDNLAPNLRFIPAVWAPNTTEVWNVDHFSALTGNLDENWVRWLGAVILHL